MCGGQAAKIANNLMLGITLAATCEGAVLADRLGLDHRIFYEMVKVSSGDSWTFRTWYPMPGQVPPSRQHCHAWVVVAVARSG